MRTIQSVGTEIFNGDVKPFYIFLGEDYGIKSRYIDKIKGCYNNQCVEINKVSKLFEMFKGEFLIPPIPKLYIVRYDSDWVSALNDRTKESIATLKIIGTAVLVFEDKKQGEKINKYLPDYCVSFDRVGSSLIIKYLLSDYPKIPESIVRYLAESVGDYFRCDTICRQILNLPVRDVEQLSDEVLSNIFYISADYAEDNLKAAIRNRNTNYLLKYLSSGADISNFLYTILSTMLDIEKGISNKYHKGTKSLWTFEDVYNYYDIVYDMLNRMRSERIDAIAVLSTLVMLLRYNPIPNLEDIYVV